MFSLSGNTQSLLGESTISTYFIQILNSPLDQNDSINEVSHLQIPKEVDSNNQPTANMDFDFQPE